jgi:hypothetical protein
LEFSPWSLPCQETRFTISDHLSSMVCTFALPTGVLQVLVHEAPETLVTPASNVRRGRLGVVGVVGAACFEALECSFFFFFFFFFFPILVPDMIRTGKTAELRNSGSVKISHRRARSANLSLFLFSFF